MIAIDPLFVRVVQWSLGGLFLFSGITKLRDMSSFTQVLAQYRLVPGPLVLPVAGLVVGAEIGAGAMALILGGPIASAVMVALLLLYAAGIVINLLRGRDHIDCGCLGFGTARVSIGWELVVRNALLAALGTLILGLPLAARTLGVIDWISALGGLASFALVYLSFGQSMVVRWHRGAANG